MKYIVLTVIIISSFSVGCSSTGGSSPQRGCVNGNCQNGYGEYIYSDNARYTGFWKNGKLDGNGVYYLSNGDARQGKWVDNELDGVIKYYFASGGTTTEYWDHGKDITKQVRSCQKAKTLTNAYKVFVGIVNAFAAGSRGDNVAEGAAWGWDAAGKQSIPKAVDIYCK